MDESSREVPVYRDDAAREEGYAAAEAEGRPYLAVEATGDDYGVVYDLLPAGARLSQAAAKRLRESVTAAVEDVVASEDRATAEVQHGLGAEMGALSGFATEASAREVAAAVADVVCEEGNWA